MTHLFRKSILFFLLFLLVKCGDQNPDSPLIARVGKSRLYLSDLEEMLPKSHLAVTRLQAEQYAERWMENEMIYQEAVRQKYDSDRQVQAQLERLKKEIIVAGFLEQLIDRTVQIDENELVSYYEEKGSEFVREKDLYLVDVLIVESYRDARSLHQEINKGLDFATAAQENSIDSSREEGGHLGWISLDQVSPELAKRIQSLKLEQLSQPVKIEIGYALIRILDIRKKGETPTLEEIRDQLAWRLQNRKREQLYRKLVSQLSENMDVENHRSTIHSAFPDTLKQ
ncbi:peptidylprolyl isomerase [candidate division KSB1 bacterium]|nr:peptidylprolyl isomerase [candidate division KSB1 bacterium]